MRPYLIDNDRRASIPSSDEVTAVTETWQSLTLQLEFQVMSKLASFIESQARPNIEHTPLH